MEILKYSSVCLRGIAKEGNCLPYFNTFITYKYRIFFAKVLRTSSQSYNQKELCNLYLYSNLLPGGAGENDRKYDDLCMGAMGSYTPWL